MNNSHNKIDYEFSKEEIDYLTSIGFSGWDTASKYGMSYDFENGDRISMYKSQGAYILICYFDTEARTRKIFDSFKEMIKFMEN